MTRVILAIAMGVLVGCSATIGPSVAADSTAAPRSSAPAPTPAPTPCSLGFGIAEIGYGTLREYAELADGVAIAEVVDVSPLRYSTEGGERPSCEYLGASGSVFSVGRMIELRVETAVAGSLDVGDPVRYWLGGGSIGGDSSDGHHFGLEAPAVGDRMVAFVMHEPGDLDGGSGVLEVNAYDLLAIDADGRILTPNPDENLAVDTVKAALEAQPSP